MFTGIIQAVGRMKSLKGGRLILRASLGSIPVGASVAVNGACLTVVRRRPGEIEFDLSPETLRLTNLALLKNGDPVNLERPLRLGDTLDGHLVSGHVDRAAKILETRPLPEGCLRIRVALPAPLRRLVSKKGSIVVDGISLTVTRKGPKWFESVLIPHTLKVTNLGLRRAGDLVNLEADLIARTVDARLSRK